MDFELIWANQEVSESLVSLFEEWALAADKVLRSGAASRMPTEWAKKPECWEHFKNETPSLTDPLPPELAAQSSATAPTSRSKTVAPLTTDELSLIGQARQIEAVEWLKIANWGKRNKQTFRLSGIASTLAQYAADGWSKSPSVKQAKWGLELAKQYAAAGLEAE